MYPNPAVNATASAPKVEDFPYVTEEFFVSGTAKRCAVHDTHHRAASDATRAASVESSWLKRCTPVDDR